MDINILVRQLNNNNNNKHSHQMQILDVYRLRMKVREKEERSEGRKTSWKDSRAVCQTENKGTHHTPVLL
jgi:hypothetical protein